MMKRLLRNGVLIVIVLGALTMTACGAILDLVSDSRYQAQARAALKHEIEALTIPADFTLLHQFDEGSTNSMGIYSWANSELFFGSESSIETVLSEVEWGLANAGWVRSEPGSVDNPWKLDDRVFLNLYIMPSDIFVAEGDKFFRQWKTQDEDAAPYSTVVMIRIRTGVNHPQ